MSDLLTALAFAYRRKGGPTMERSKLLHMLAFDLRWMSPDQAKRAITRALEAGLLREDADKLHATFDADAVDIPVNFRPRDDVADAPVQLAAPPPPPKGAPPDEAALEREKRGALVSLDVARLIVARRRGDDVVAAAKELETKL